MAIFFTFSPTSSHLYPLQSENCDSNSQLVVDEDDKGKFRLDRVNKYLDSNSTNLENFYPPEYVICGSETQLPYG